MFCVVFWANITSAAPYAALVMDARTGEVLHSRNADTPLHPASLTKMMTLYLVFNEVEAGRMSLDQMVTISANAASEPPSKLGLRAGQRIALRYLIRAAAIKSANDAATALGEAVSGTEAEFAKYMTATARAMGMTNTTFKNAHGLTASGHLSTARDMALLGRRLFYDFPDYYNLFSRISTETTVKTVYNTNRRFLQAYQGADGIKTGYTRAAGFNLVASAQRGNERIIASMFGGTSTAQRNAQVAKLLDMGFDRAPTRSAVLRPPRLHISPQSVGVQVARVPGFVARTDRPVMRGGSAPTEPSVVLMTRNIEELVTTVVSEGSNDQNNEIASIVSTIDQSPSTVPLATAVPALRPSSLDTSVTAEPAPVQTASLVPTMTVTDVSPVSEPGDWVIQIGAYPSRTATEKLLLQTALMDLDSLQGADRHVHVTKVRGATMYEAQFVGLSQTDAQKACLRLRSREMSCEVVGATN